MYYDLLFNKIINTDMELNNLWTHYLGIIMIVPEMHKEYELYIVYFELARTGNH